MFRLVAFVTLSFLGAASQAAATKAAPACAAPAAGVAESQRKFHPGHYAAVGRAEQGNLVAAAQTPGITGVQRRYRWSQLEPQEGNYDFSVIARDLESIARSGGQLVAMIEDKSFDGTMPLPAYLANYALRGERGFVAKRWDPFVVDRFVRLVAALGSEFDCSPNFEGVALQESALSLETATLSDAGYTAAKYRDALVQLLRGAAAAVPRSRVFWYMNYLPGKQSYLADVAGAVTGTGVVMGGPDILPDNTSLAERVYPLYDRFNGRLKLFGSMQHDSYRHPRGARGRANAPADATGYWSLEELFAFARDELHVDYVFWEYRSKQYPANTRSWNEAREVIARHPPQFRAGQGKGST